mgnify:CR=1 FL=1
MVKCPRFLDGTCHTMNDVSGSGIDTCTGEVGYLYEMVKKNAVSIRDLNDYSLK